MAKHDRLEQIAREHLGIDTLETRNRDALDFHEVGVAGLRDALAAAYEAGRLSAKPTTCTCPACGRTVEVRAL
ncbi:MAG: hypothetical protein KDB18_04170 [Salinibacterium sp.]|nr:hypothetical protein [Salinibacterium sp.]